MYHYDPSDASKPTIGQTVYRLLSVPVVTQSSLAEDLLSYMTYRELMGYGDPDDDYDGYPLPDILVDTPETSFGHLFDLDNSPTGGFDSCLFAVASWHRVLHKDLDPLQLQPYLGYAPLKVIRRTIARTTQMAKMIIRTP